jgi:hypothetical protein
MTASLVIAAMVLPSALRPPQDQPQSSSAFSPDAPPDKEQSVFSSFNQASSGTPGGLEEITPTSTTVPPATGPATTLPPKKLASACPYGFGNPPRQVESVYSPPCAPAFTGSNGGSTSKGVTATEIRHCFLMELTGSRAQSGEILGGAAQPGENAVNRTYRVLLNYFNSRLQLYGRQLRFFYSAGDSSKSGPEKERSRAAEADESQNCFSAIQETNPASIDELTRRKIVTFTLAQVPESYFAPRDPYLWSFTPAGSQAVRMGAEYACKKLVGKPPKFTDDPTFDQTKPRKFGFIIYNLPEYDNPGPTVEKLMKDCGADVGPTVTYDLTGSGSGSQGLSSAVTQMKVAGVTTIFYLGDLISAGIFTQSAGNNYYPEWFLPGFGGVDSGHIARNYHSDQWKHAFGFSFYEITQPDEETECYKAYHEIDPSSEPDSGMCIYLWGNMVQLFGAMQEAGANLTPQTLKAAFLKQPPLKPSIPYHMAGGYGPNDHTFPDYATEMWWDPAGVGSDGELRTYRFTNNGRRYTYGQWDTDDSKLFKEGVTLAPPS